MTSQMMHETINVIVARKTLIAEDICLYELQHEAPGTPLPDFEAGAHVDVHAGDFIRQYSLCGTPGPADSYQIAVLRDPASRGGSHYMHDQVQPGMRLRVSAPRNLFPLHAAEPEDHSVLLAGGIGITPILAMAEALHARGASFELHYFSRSAARTAFRERLKECAFRECVHFHHDDDPARSDLATVLGNATRTAHLYFCGPGGFIDAIQQTTAALQWDPAKVHFERFSAQPVAGTGEDVTFTVRIASTGQEVTVPADVSITSALSDEGVVIPVACEQGVCGTCLTGVLEGDIDHRDQYLTDDERALNNQMTPCCSRARSGVLVLDL